MSMIHVIIPVYNAEKHLQMAVDSVLNQPSMGIDIVLVNDGSTDSSPTLCDSIAAKEERVTVIHQENGGVSAARNTGIEYFLERCADEDYIAFLDADDAWVSDVITSSVIASCGTNDMVMFQFYAATASVTRLRPVQSAMIGPIRDPSAYSLWDISVYAWNKFYRVSFLKAHKLKFLTEVRCGEDACFVNAALYYAKSVISFDHYLLYYRCNPNSITHTYGKRGTGPWLDEICGMLRTLDLFGIQDPGYRRRTLDFCCWLFLEMSEAYYLQLHLGSKPYDILKSHTLQEHFRSSDIGLSQWDKERIQFMLNHKFLFRAKFLTKGIIIAFKSAAARLPFFDSFFEKRRYPLLSYDANKT